MTRSRLFQFLLMCAGMLLSSATYAEDELKSLLGQWTPITGPSTGAPFSFSKAFMGYDAWIPWWGQATIIASDGSYGSHIKVAGAKDGENYQCFYYISPLPSNKMAWNLKRRDIGFCPDSLVFERVVQSKDLQQASAAAPKKIISFPSFTHNGDMFTSAPSTMGGVGEEGKGQLVYYANRLDVNGTVCNKAAADYLCRKFGYTAAIDWKIIDGQNWILFFPLDQIVNYARSGYNKTHNLFSELACQ